MTEMSSVAALQNVSKTFTTRTRQVHAVDDVSFELRHGEVLGLLGRNGAGKTTTLKILLGLVRPTGGQVSVLGMNPVTHARRIMESVGYVSEQPVLYTHETLDQLLRFCAPLYPTWDLSRALNVAKLFSLPLDLPTEKMSRGQQAQAALVLALANQPKILVLDEPTAGFDPVARRQFMQVLSDEISSRQCAVLISSHDLDEIDRISDRIAIIVEGRLAALKTREELATSERQVQAIFPGDAPDSVMNHPAVRSVRKAGRRLLFTVSGDVDAFISLVEKTPHLAMEVTNMSLEEIFLAYTGGRCDQNGQ
jgi:ABC-2 type transport system ATP-binding protein